MKRLEELGISPAPWRADLSIDDVAWIEDRRLNDIVRLDKYELKNARLIAAAPKLYKALYQSLAFSCKGCEHNDDVSCDKSCVFAKWRAALAEAAEEEVGDGK